MQKATLVMPEHWIAQENLEIWPIAKAKLHSNKDTTFRDPETFANGLAEFPEDPYGGLEAGFYGAHANCGTLQECGGS